jgi:hypothetical protein
MATRFLVIDGKIAKDTRTGMPVALTDNIFTNVTYEALKTMRDNGHLLAGEQYRITDYVCTTSQQDTQSAGHPFDIIVVADSPNTLNENARAVAHEGDTYFANCKLSAWEIKYCLDNDKTRFWWAFDGQMIVNLESGFSNGTPLTRQPLFDGRGAGEYQYAWGTQADVEDEDGTNFLFSKTETLVNGEVVYNILENTYLPVEVDSGKGVIYYLKDEYGNECPYDFKNIQFKRWQTDTEIDEESIVYSSWDDTGNDFRWCYTFMAYNLDTMEFYGDASILPHKNFGSDEGVSNCLGNIIKPYECEYEAYEVDDSQHGRLFLNNIVLYGFNYGEAVDTEEFDYNTNYMPRCNTFGYQCYLMTIGHKQGDLSRDNTFGNNCFRNCLSGANNTFGNACQYNRVTANSCTFYTGVGGKTIEDSQWDKEYVNDNYELVKGNGAEWETGYVNAGRTKLRSKGWYEIDYPEGGRTFLYNEITKGESPPYFVQTTDGVILRYFYVNSSSYLCSRSVYLTDGSYTTTAQFEVRYRQISNE